MITLRSLQLKDVRSLSPIPSGFETDRVYRLRRCESASGVTWRLEEERLDVPFRKTYDTGHPDEWLDSYDDAGPLDDFRFDAAFRNGGAVALLTSKTVQWNNSTWLMDIRVRLDQRRRGAGAALVRALQDAVRKEGRRGISVETQINNYPAIQFYRKHGFEIAGFNDHLYLNDDLARQDVAVFLFWEAT